jgi:hypothetical protein
MKVLYTRGDFRVVKYDAFYGYQVQARHRHGTWQDIFVSFDYLGNARRRVRNLHAACCTHLEVSDYVPGLPKAKRRRKAPKPLDLKPCKDA